VRSGERETLGVIGATFGATMWTERAAAGYGSTR
jgi:hypothetical protein